MKSPANINEDDTKQISSRYLTVELAGCDGSKLEKQSKPTI